MRKIILLVAATLLSVVAFAVPASAQYGDSPAAGVSNPNPGVGESVTVTGGNCSGGVTVLLDGEVVGTGSAGGDGTFAIGIDMPTEPGTYVLTVTCEAPGGVAASATSAVLVGSGELAAGVQLAGGLPVCGAEAGDFPDQGEWSCLITVGDADVTTSGTLPRTGGDSLPLASIGVVLLALGGLAILVTRKRSVPTA